MKKIKFLDLVIFVLCILIIATGCATFTPSKQVFKGKPNFNFRTYDAPIETCWLAVRQAILKNNFSIFIEDNQVKRIQAAKSFAKGSLSATVTIQFTLQSCEENKTQVYLNATQTTKRIYTARQTVPLLFILPIPAGTEASQTQTEQTIEDKKFYEAFFNQIETELKGLMQK